ncbi:MAG: DNA gyrase C-terminal beta-propeller domain-containing protein [Kouleothrix sp.]
MTQGNEDVLLTTARGQTIRFRQEEVRPMGRPASGVIGINLSGNDRVVGYGSGAGEGALLTVTTHGFGKRTLLDEYLGQRPRHGWCDYAEAAPGR